MVVKNWASILDESTRLQAEMLGRSPAVCGHVALMPDAHLGIGATVGSVIPTKRAIIPAAVGVDIGCGMIAVRTSLTHSDLSGDLSPLYNMIASRIPAGVGQGHQHVRYDQWLTLNPPVSELGMSMLDLASKQMGTLGSGNHFVEVCLDLDGVVWGLLHSGSRGIGNKLATFHMKAAIEYCRANTLKLEHKDLAYFEEGTPEFDAYIMDMEWAQRYAFRNREVMMDGLLDGLFAFAAGEELSRVNCHHNFSQIEEHFGQLVWLTRKGAISAYPDQWGIIPGSMGAKSYIVQGLGNPDSYCSSPHGAGRQMSRGQAKRELSVESLQESMAGRTWGVQDAKALLDEHPNAYKDIDVVMEDAKDLVAPVYQLAQIVNYKGL
jgi:RNA-splicing ligase RtcB